MLEQAVRQAAEHPAGIPCLSVSKGTGVAAAALRSGSAVTARQLTPRYLRLPQAERERKERLQQAEEKGKDCCK